VCMIRVFAYLLFVVFWLSALSVALSTLTRALGVLPWLPG
jgi:hypothetical protein